MWSLAFGGDVGDQLVGAFQNPGLLLGIPLGFASASFQTVDVVVLQQATEPSLQGRVMALHQMAQFGSTPIGALAMGWIAEAASPRVPFVLGAVATIGCAAGLALSGRSARLRSMVDPAPALDGAVS